MKRVDVYVVLEYIEMRRVVIDYEYDKYDGEKDCFVVRGLGRLLRVGWDYGEGGLYNGVVVCGGFEVGGVVWGGEGCGGGGVGEVGEFEG